MADQRGVSIIIPVFNEAENLGQLLDRLRSVLLPSWEVIVVDDGSTDGSSEIAEKRGARVIRHPYNIGNGAAIKNGIRAARGRLLVFMDGDGQHQPEDIPKLLSGMNRYHMVVGAREGIELAVSSLRGQYDLQCLCFLRYWFQSAGSHLRFSRPFAQRCPEIH